MDHKKRMKRCLLGAAALSVLVVTPIAQAAAEAPPAGTRLEVDIQASPLGDALRAFSAKTGVPIIFSESQVAGLKAGAIRGTFTTAEALQAILDGTGLVALRGGSGAYVLRASASEPGRAGPARDSDDPAAPERISDKARDGDAPELRAETIVVTGTSLRGLSPESSPVQVFSRDEILGSGVTSTEQFIRTLPQNFGGGSSEFASRGLPNDRSSQNNSTFGSGANLRGLGTGATLTLVNGARLAPTSTIGDFVDVSLIPVTAIERIEVLSDGASSIYGGDAVAGVVNLILRGDFEGAETAIRYGSVTEGSLEEIRLGQTLGKSWSGGNLMGTYEYFDRGRLSLSDRPEIAAPTLLNGGAIAVSDAIDLLPEQERHSLVLSGRQSLGERLEVASTALYSKREVTTLGVGIANTTTVSKYKSSSESVTANIVADYELSARSSLSLDAGYSEVRNDDFQQQFSPATGPQIFDQTESSLWSVGVLANTELFDLPAGPLRAAVGGQFRHEAFRTQQIGSAVLRDGTRDVSALFAEISMPLVGEDNAMPGIRRLELNLSGRFDDYSDFGTTTNPKVGLLWAPVDGVRLRTSYSTSFAPPKLGQSGALDRGVGILPYDVVRRVLNIALPDPSLAGVNYMITSGTADDLDPETSRTFTAGFDIDRSGAGHDLSISGNYYDISFEDRLGITPVPGNLNANFAPGLAFNDPTLFPEGTVVFFPTNAQIDAVLASLNRPVTFAAGATAIENIGFINNVSLTRNLASTKTSGLDLEVAYGMDADVGRLTAKLSANYILDFTQQASETTPSVETLNTLYNPVDLQLRGQLGLSRGGLSGSVFFNYVDRYQTDGTSTAKPIRFWSTVDLNIAYRFEEGAPDWLQGTSIGLSALNLFDRAPPPTPPQTSFAIAGYDPANANPLGRFIAVDIRKSF